MVRNSLKSILKLALKPLFVSALQGGVTYSWTLTSYSSTTSINSNNTKINNINTVFLI